MIQLSIIVHSTTGMTAKSWEISEEDAEHIMGMLGDAFMETYVPPDVAEEALKLGERNIHL